MNRDRFDDEILRLSQAVRPEILLVKRATIAGPCLGVFAASFNPVTTAHIALIDQAASRFSLHHVLALAGVSNADKRLYDCPLSQRLEMLELALGPRDNVSIGISSTAFFVDMVEPIARSWPSGLSLYFIVGFDTFIRIIDFEGRYLGRYDKRFSDRSAVIEYLLGASRFIVASRRGLGGGELAELVGREPRLSGDRVLFLDLPVDLAERSATEVRERLRAGLGITGLVPAAVERYIQANKLYWPA
jgi:nicotinate-nucleotide adenylyltransferase